MKLSEQDRQEFFSLFLPLLDYVNKRDGTRKSLWNYIHDGDNTSEKLRGIAQKLWADTSYIDDYLALPEKESLSQDARDTILGWKRHIDGSFILERHLARGSIFIDIRTQNVYLVKGLTDSWQEMVRDMKPPISIEATLLPFKGVIISDGLVAIHPFSFGREYKNTFQNAFWVARQNHAIIKEI